MQASVDELKSQSRPDVRNEGPPTAEVIEFYVPSHFRRKVKWIPLQERGKVIAFASPVKKSA